MNSSNKFEWAFWFMRIKILLYAGLVIGYWGWISWEFSSKILLTLNDSPKNESWGSLNYKSTGIWESLMSVRVFTEGFPSIGVRPKSIFWFSTLILGVITLAFNGKIRVFPPLIKKETVESTFVDENPWILKIIYCMPSPYMHPFIGNAETICSISLERKTL